MLLVLGLSGASAAWGQSNPLPETVVRDQVTGCVVYIRLPPTLINAQLGRVTSGFWNDPPSCVNGVYQGKLMFGWRATHTNKDGETSDFQGIRYGYAVDGRIQGLLLNMFFGSVVVADNGRLIKQFNKTDDGYTVQQVYDTFSLALAERNAGNTYFELPPVNFIVKMWDSNHNVTLKHYATSQSDDLKVFGRSARGG
jgi:hypothetical protein